MIISNVVVSNEGNVYLPQVFRQEDETAYKIAQMVTENPKPVDLRPVMEAVKGKLGITLSPRQVEGVEMAFRYNLSIITGGPGTGKSTILRAVVEAYRLLFPDKTISRSGRSYRKGQPAYGGDHGSGGRANPAQPVGAPRRQRRSKEKTATGYRSSHRR